MATDYRKAAQSLLDGDLPPVPTPTLRPGDRVAVHRGDDTRTFTVPRSDQEPGMTPSDRHDELVALLTEIRDRLPEPESVNAVEDTPADDGLAEWERELLRPATFAPYPPTEGETDDLRTV